MIREEFEKAFEAYEDEAPYPGGRHAALWAAKWMAERCAIAIEGLAPYGREEGSYQEDVFPVADKIRQLAKELE